ncbi:MULTISPECIES: RDD family protein [Bacillota]|nr:MULTISPECIES: RDD family protein [Bacillota]MCH4285786.1 RDD family protein [Amedibacillus hominis]
MMTNTKKANKIYNEPKGKSKKVYNEPKLGFIDRLTVKLMSKQGSKLDENFPPVGNLRRFFGYLMDFFLANVLAVIPLVFIESRVTGSTETTQVLAGLPLPYVYLITALVFLLYILYYVVIPLKVWPGQTPAKRLLNYKIVMMDGSDVTLKALLLRNVFAMTFVEGAAFTTTYVIQLVVLTAGIDYPKFISYVCYFMTLLSIVVTWTNPNRRMLHDFIGGTKVYQLEHKTGNYKAF